MQETLLRTSAPSHVALTDLSLHHECAPDKEPDSYQAPDISCVAQLTSLQTPSIEGLRYTCSTARAIRSLRALTALRMHGYVLLRPYQSDLQHAVSCCLPGLVSLDVEFVVPHSLRRPPPESAIWELRREGRGGSVPARVLCALPLHLGARITVTTRCCPQWR